MLSEISFKPYQAFKRVEYKDLFPKAGQNENLEIKNRHSEPDLVNLESGNNGDAIVEELAEVSSENPAEAFDILKEHKEEIQEALEDNKAKADFLKKVQKGASGKPQGKLAMNAMILICLAYAAKDEFILSAAFSIVAGMFIHSWLINPDENIFCPKNGL